MKFKSILPVLILFLATSLGAQALVGPEYQINNYTQDDQLFPSVAADASGNFIVGWESKDQYDGQDAIGRRVLPGPTLWVEGPLSGNFAGDQTQPDVAMADDTEWVAVFTDEGQDGNGDGILGRRYTSSDWPYGFPFINGDFQVNTWTTSNQRNVAVSMDDSRDFVVVWQSNGQDGNSWGVFGQRFLNDPTVFGDLIPDFIGSEFQVNTWTTNTQSQPDVVSKAGGDFIVTWRSGGNQDGNGDGIFARLFSSTGVPTTPEIQVNQWTTDHQREPRIANDPAGHFVIVWEEVDGIDGDGLGVFGRLFDSSGAPFGNEFQVNSFTTGNQSNPAVAMADDGCFLVTWNSAEDQDGDGDSVVAQMFDAVGLPMGAELQVNTFTTGIQRRPDVTWDGTDFIVVWESRSQELPDQNDNYGIFTQAICKPLSTGVGNTLMLREVNGGADILFTWTDVPADDFAVVEDALPNGTFATTTGTAPSGVGGLTSPLPGPPDLHYLVAPQDGCGRGPLHTCNP